MGRNRESRTGIAVLVFIVASTAAQFNSPADLRDDCTDKSDGIYPTGHCSTYFLECSGGKTTKQNCSTGLWFNPQSSQCDYRENIVACQESFSCIGRDDGVYGEGCSSMFWYCSGGQLKHSLCPNKTFFNPQSQQCDFRSNIKACGDSTSSSVQNARSNRLTTVPPTTQSPSTEAKIRDWTEVPYGQTYPTYAPRQRISGRVSKTPLDESSAGTACAGKEDGSHSMEKCSGQYVLCWAGTGKVMNCQKGLLFNEVSHVCDYPLNVDGCNGSPSASLDKSYGGVFSAAPSTASLPIPRQPIENDCSSLPDGVYGSLCSRNYFHCVNGVSYEKSCTEGLVYNAVMKQCDYKEKCESSSSLSIASSDAPITLTPVITTVEKTIDFDCSSLPDGSYSQGCISQFYQCSSGMAIIQKCPDGLVFDDFTKACDYPQICSSPHSSVSHDSMSSVSSRPSTTPIPITSPTLSFDCSSRVDGLYSLGCVSHYFECSSGVVSSYLCPDGRVFDGVSQKCDYPNKCGQPRPLDEESSVYNLSPTVPSSDYNKKNVDKAPIVFDCSSVRDGSYGSSCSSSFIQCVAGMAYTQQCPQGLVFDEENGSCDYPERCGKISNAVEVPVMESSSVQSVQGSLTPIDIDCFNRPDGLYSSGCSRTYVQCANGMAFNQLCQEGLVFIQASGVCDYASSCSIVSSSPSSTVPYAPSPPSSSPYKPSIVNETPSPLKRDEPSGVIIDCSTLANGRYTSGCTHAFVQCSNGAAVPLECPAGLVFDKRVDQCVWPESCSSMDSPSLPIVSLPIRPSDVPSTVYDMKEEKDEMVTDAPLPEVSKDGSVCTGTGRRAMGKCSSGFVQCIGGKMVARRCPGQSLFDEKIGLCVYDMDGCEMDVDIVDGNEEEPMVAATVTPQQDISSSGYNREPVQSVPSYPQQTASQSVYQQQYSQNSPQDQYQNGYPAQAAPTQYQDGYPTQAEPSQYQNGYQAQAAPSQYQNRYQSVPAYPTSGYQSAHQSSQYQTGYGFESVPVYSSFDSSLSSQSHSSPECDIGSFRRVSACSPSFDTCSPTARQWIRRICGKSHRFDSTVNRCRPIFEIRECDEPMSSYIPPPVQMEVPAVYPNPATSFENGVPLSGREYQDNHVRDPFKGGYKSGMMGSNPFVAIGNTGSFYTEDGLRWVGSAWSEGGERRKGGKRHHKQRHHLHHSGDYVIVSGNPFGAGRDRVLNDKWEGRRRYDGPVRSSLTHARGHRVRNVEDNFKGRVSHFAPPLRDVNPFAVKRGDGYRRKGRKSCRRDKHRRRDDWKDEDCEEEKELERPTARSVIDENDENEEERGMGMEEEPIEENEDTESMEESTVEGETSEESKRKELEVNEDENEKNEADPELLPESIDNEETNEIDEVNEEEKDEQNEETEVNDGKEETEDTSEEKEDGEDVNEVEKTEENEEMNEEDEEIEDVNEETEESTEENEDGEGVNEIEKTEENIETTTMKGPFEEVDDKIEERKNEEDEDDDDEEESVNESTEEEDSSDEKNIEERAESESGEENEEKENAEDVSEEEIEKEIEEERETTEETINEDVESPESVEKEETTENEKDEESEDGNTNENEEIEAANGGETEEIEEEGEMTEETKNEDVESPESIEKEEIMEENREETEEIEEDGKNEKEEVDGEKEDEESDEKTSEAVNQTEENEEEKVEEEEEMKDEETDKDQMKESEEIDPEQPESVDNEVNEEDEVEKTEENEETTTKKGSFEEVDDKVEERNEEDEDDNDEEESVNESTEEEESSDGKNIEEKAETDEEIEETENGVEDEVEKVEDENIEEEVENEDEKNEEEVNGDVSNTEAFEDNKNGNEGLNGFEIKFEQNENSEKSEEEIKEEENEETNDDDDEESDNQNGGNDEDSENLPEAVENKENRRLRRSVVYDGSSTQSSSSIRRRLSIPRSSRLHRSRFSRLCVSSSTGQIISIGQCRQDFIYCKSTRRPVVAACPVGDLFDAVESTCVPTEICGAERVKMDIPSPTPSSSSSSYIREGERPTMPIPTDSIVNDNEKKTIEDTNDCSSLSDGAYPISGCSSHYFVCSASVKHMYTCPSGLIYHKGSDGCEWPTNVVECTGGAASDTTSSPISIPTENEYSDHSTNRDILATTVPTTVSPMHVHFDCIKNGGFAIDCKGGFVMCSNGISSFMKCSPSLVFDDATQACQYPAHVGSCGLTSSSVLDVPSIFSPVYTPLTTSSSPAMAVETLVTTPVHKDACIGGSNSLEGATKVCATSFVICKEGEVTAVMNCPVGTFFNEKTKECDYREVACSGGWNGEAQGVESPVEEDVPTVSTVIESEEYNRRASRPYRPLMPLVVEKIEKIDEVKNEEVIVERPMVIPSNIEPSKDATCDWKGTAQSGLCSSQFITCSNGKPEVMLCSSGLVFSSSTSACEYSIFVSGCPQFKPSSPYTPSLPSTPSPVSDTIMDESSSSSSEYIEYTRHSIPSTTTVNPLLAPIENGEHTTAKFEATGDHCTFFADRPAFPLNYCSMTFAVCTAQGMAYRTNCSFGFLFDSVLRQCVPSEHCGQPYIKDIAAASPTSSSPHHTLGGWEKDSRCVGMKDGTLKAMDICSGQYIKCFNEEVLVQSCSGTGRVFSSLTGRCVMHVQMAECSSPKGSIPAITRPKNVSPSTPSSDALSSSSDSYSTTSLPIPSHRGSRIRGGLPVSSPSTQFDASTFCTTKHTDGLYRNPENCAGIVQCFGGEAFSYPSCAPGLFFNEVDSQCDYASNVPECASQTDPIALDDTSASCKGQPHGAHLADDSDCSIYYRCVWGSLERLTCPDGTVFNPRLSVCDYSSQVPHCLKQ